LPGRHIDGRIVSFNEGTGWIREFLWLVGVGEVVELGFEGLIVLALDLQLGLEFFDQEFEARDFGAEFQGVGWDLTLTWRVRLTAIVERAGVAGWRGRKRRSRG